MSTSVPQWLKDAEDPEVLKRIEAEDRPAPPNRSASYTHRAMMNPVPRVRKATPTASSAPDPKAPPAPGETRPEDDAAPTEAPPPSLPKE